MNEAWLIVLGAALALVSGGATELLRERLTRDQQRKERRDAFQREHLLALQESLFDVRGAALDLLRILPHGGWPEGSDFGGYHLTMGAAGGRIVRHQVLVEDDELRHLVDEMKRPLVKAPFEESDEKSEAAWEQAEDIFHEVNQRIGKLILSL